MKANHRKRKQRHNGRVTAKKVSPRAKARQLTARARENLATKGGTIHLHGNVQPIPPDAEATLDTLVDGYRDYLLDLPPLPGLVLWSASNDPS